MRRLRLFLGRSLIDGGLRRGSLIFGQLGLASRQLICHQLLKGRNARFQMSDMLGGCDAFHLTGSPMTNLE
jgi:hypothetical protein